MGSIKEVLYTFEMSLMLRVPKFILDPKKQTWFDLQSETSLTFFCTSHSKMAAMQFSSNILLWIAPKVSNSL